jgi:GT2 family glycosyltransferase
VLECTELLEPLGPLKGGRLERWIGDYSLAAERVKPEVVQCRSLACNGMRYQAAREVECVSLNVADDLDDIGVASCLLPDEGARKGGHGRHHSGEVRLHERSEHARGGKRLIALNIDDHLGVWVALRYLGHSIRPARMIPARELHLAAEALHAGGDRVVIGGNDHVVEIRTGRCGLEDPLDDRATAKVCKRLARQTRRSVPRRNDGQYLHGRVEDRGRQSRSKIVTELSGEGPRQAFQEGALSPAVSVVIPNKDNLEFLQDCVRSVLADLPRGGQGEIIIVDNGSRDDSLDWISGLGEPVKAIPLGRNAGFAAACNLGARAALGGVVIFLNNDTVVTSGWSEPLVRCIKDNPEVVIAGGLTLFMDRPDYVNSAAIRIGASAAGSDVGFDLHHDQVDLRPREVAGVSGVSMAVDREWFLDAGGFDEAFFMYFEDVDLCLRAWLEGRRIRFVPQSRVLHAFGGTAGSRFSETRNYYASRNRLLISFKLLSPGHAVLGILLSVLQDIAVVTDLTMRGRRQLAQRAAVGKMRGMLSALAMLPRYHSARRDFQRRRKVDSSALYRLGIIDSPFVSLNEFYRFRRLKSPES